MFARQTLSFSSPQELLQLSPSNGADTGEGLHPNITLRGTQQSPPSGGSNDSVVDSARTTQTELNSSPHVARPQTSTPGTGRTLASSVQDAGVSALNILRIGSGHAGTGLSFVHDNIKGTGVYTAVGLAGSLILLNTFPGTITNVATETTQNIAQLLKNITTGASSSLRSDDDNHNEPDEIEEPPFLRRLFTTFVLPTVVTLAAAGVVVNAANRALERLVQGRLKRHEEGKSSTDVDADEDSQRKNTNVEPKLTVNVNNHLTSDVGMSGEKASMRLFHDAHSLSTRNGEEESRLPVHRLVH